MLETALQNLVIASIYMLHSFQTISQYFLKGKQAEMPKLQKLLDDAGITVSELSRRSNVDYRTAKKAVGGNTTITRVKVFALLRVLNEILNTSYRPEDIDDLTTH